MVGARAAANYFASVLVVLKLCTAPPLHWPALELLVAFLQAYVFAILTCIYLNDAPTCGTLGGFGRQEAPSIEGSLTRPCGRLVLL